MKKQILSIAVVVVLSMMLSVQSVLAGSISFSGTLVPGGPTMNVVQITTPNCTGVVAFPVLYQAHSFRVDAAGTYTVSATDTDNNPAVYLYENSFNPANGLTNCVAASNSGVSATFSFGLDPSKIYYVVAIEDSFAQDGDSYQISISGPGNIFAGTGGCGIDIPEGSVVGEAPLGAPVYYEPGKSAGSLALNPGTYWVIGQDASETYYKVVLACQFIWVRKDTMQPSYLPPQNGALLPTRIVK